MEQKKPGDISPARDETSGATSDKNAQFKAKLMEELKTASPLDSFSILEQVEMYEEMDARQAVENVYMEFESGENQVENIVVPVFTSVVDGLLKSLSTVRIKTDSSGVVTANKTATGHMQDMGLSATRIVQECRTFRYNETNVNTEIYSEVTRNQAMDGYDDFNQRVGTTIGEYDRGKYDYKRSQRTRALEEAKTEDGMIKDGYQETMIYADEKSAMAAEGNTSNSAQYEHIVALKKVHEQLSQNCMLTDQDVRDIANMEENFVFTAAKLNRSKQDADNKEYVKEHKHELSRETRRNMVKKAKTAQKKIDSAANKAVLQNMQNPEQLKKLGEQLGNVSKDAAKSGAKMGIGSAIIELLKPLYYEMADSFKNGFTKGVGVQKMGEAFKIRIGRVKKHLQSALKGLGLGSLTDMIKSLISSLISAIVDLFFGIVKDLLKLLQKGIPIAVSAFKVLFDKTKSPAERGDALVKLVGSSLIAILGGLLIDKIFPKEPEGYLRVLKTVCTCLLSGCGSLFFMMFMDKIDLFDVKAEKRQARIREIFEIRKAELQERASCMKVEVLSLLKEQRLCFDDLVNGAEQAVEKKDVDAVVVYSYALADFFKVELEYSNTAEFVAWWDCQEVIHI